MNAIKIPVGRSGFADIREHGFYYVDKSLLVEEIVRMEGTQVTLLTRPRRFGKTMAMSMLAEFFDIRKDSAGLFRGLAVSERKELCRAWMNQYPTVFVSFRGVDGLDFQGAYAELVSVAADVCKEHLYLLESDKVNSFDKELFRGLAAEKASLSDVKKTLVILTRMMYAHYGKPVILLMDEYDVPLAKASAKGYYEQMLDVVRGMMSVLKDNRALKFAVVTGCLRIAKESVFTGTNNLVSDTIADTRFMEYFGFTQAEVDRLLADTGLEAYGDRMKEWYDGYSFGEMDVYCPWDVTNYVSDLLVNQKASPKGYWNNSSDNAIVRSFIEYAGDEVTKKLEILLAGGTIMQQIRDDLTYDYLHSSLENLWSILYLTGYLTRDRKALLPESESKLTPLKIPNREVLEIYETTIAAWFMESSRGMDRKKLFSAVWMGDSETVTEEMNRLLRRTISYHDYREDFYHAFFAGIFAGARYAVESNREHGEGRSDITVQDYAGDRAAVFEVKYASTREGLEAGCQAALAQIDEKRYAGEFEDDYAKVLCYGIAFYKKRCLVRRKGEPFSASVLSGK